MKLILTEKPSQARDVAKAFKSKAKDGFIECEGGWNITWAFGHLLEIDTEKIFPRGKILEFPERFEYRLKKGVTKQFKIIKGLLSKADELYVFTDPEREGELLARLILIQAGWKKWDNTYRFWSSKALTPDVVWEELKAKKPIKKYDSVFYEALARQHSDWLVGIPLSRVLMEKFRGVWSVGRVQTPTLYLLALRENEIRNFKSVEYYVVKSLLDKEGEKFETVFIKDNILDKNRSSANKQEDSDDEDNKNKERDKLGLDKATAEKIVGEVCKTGKGEVIDVKKKVGQKAPPLLYSLTVLQKEAGEKFGFSAEKTLNVAQRLYEKTLISYPRTESQHLSTKDKDLAKEVLKKLGRSDLIKAVDKVGKRVFDDSKLTDHFALIPLRGLKRGETLSDDEQKIYDMVVKRFLAVWYPDFVWEETSVFVRIGEYLFMGKGKVVKEKGWTEILGGGKDVYLPSLQKGDIVIVDSAKAERKETKPPRRFSDGLLVNRMKKLGIGTPATRAGVIEALIKRGYVIRNKKELIPSEKGMELAKKLAECKCKLINVELTGEWEKGLGNIRGENLGFLGYKKFVEDIKDFVRENVSLLRKIEINKEILEQRKFTKTKSKYSKKTKPFTRGRARKKVY